MYSFLSGLLAPNLFSEMTALAMHCDCNIFLFYAYTALYLGILQLINVCVASSFGRLYVKLYEYACSRQRVHTCIHFCWVHPHQEPNCQVMVCANIQAQPTTLTSFFKVVVPIYTPTFSVRDFNLLPSLSNILSCSFLNCTHAEAFMQAVHCC